MKIGPVMMLTNRVEVAAVGFALASEWPNSLCEPPLKWATGRIIELYRGLGFALRVLERSAQD
ncbi:MAG: hypothetical protein ACREQ4_02745 [Candidatus Binataceae bacterium]